MLDETESKTVHNGKEGDQQRKSKTISVVKLVENMTKNLLSFLEISLIQKEILLSHKLQDHAYE